MKRIWKYKVPLADKFTLKLPTGARILHFAEQHGIPCLWALVNPDAPIDYVQFRLYGTGHPVEDNTGEYIGTALCRGSMFVWHLFRVR